jgi:calcium-dependent protein kinase
MANLRDSELIIKSGEQFFREYAMGEAIGKGAYGQVSSVERKQTRAQFAVKAIPLASLKRDCQHELAISWKMVHPHIVTVHDIFQNSSSVYIVMERCRGGSLQHKVKSALSKGLCNSEVVRYVGQMASGLAYMHHHRFAHRDVKPSNFVFTGCSSDSGLQLIDMGLACPVESGVPLTSRVGTLECSAPEVVRGSYDEMCDIWSLGVVIYFCCVGELPFEGAGSTAVCQKILSGEPSFRTQDWTQDRCEVKSLVSDMLSKRAVERPSARDIATVSAGWLARPDVEQPALRYPHEVDANSCNMNGMTDVKSDGDSSERSSPRGMLERAASNTSLRSASTACSISSCTRPRASKNAKWACQQERDAGHVVFHGFPDDAKKFNQGLPKQVRRKLRSSIVPL